MRAALAPLFHCAQWSPWVSPLWSRTTARTVAAVIGGSHRGATLIMSAVPRSEKHRQWPSPVGFRALKKRRSTRLNRPTPCTPRGAQGADLAAPLVGNGENGRRRRRCQFRGQMIEVCILLAGSKVVVERHSCLLEETRRCFLESQNKNTNDRLAAVTYQMLMYAVRS